MTVDDISTIHLTEEALNKAIFEAIVQLLVNDASFKAWVAQAVEEEVKVQAPGNPRMNAVIRGVQEHLDRYPAIADDIGLQDAVGKAVFEYLQGKL